MKLSVIIPVYNEKDTVGKIIEKVMEVPVDKEIIVVDDGSTDSTKMVLREIIEKNKDVIKVIFKEKNEGKGAAIREGIKYVSGDVVVIQDADLEYDPMDFLKMLKVMEEKNAKVVYGSRILGKNKKMDEAVSFFHFINF